MQNYLVHSAKGSTWEKKDHKYYIRIKRSNGSYRYFYSKEEYIKYLKTTLDPNMPDYAKDAIIKDWYRKDWKREFDDIERKEFLLQEAIKADKKRDEKRNRLKENATNEYIKRKESTDELAKEFGIQRKTAYGEKETLQQSQKRTNDLIEYYLKNESYRTNCYSCAYAYDLRQRGYNAEAIPNDNIFITIDGKKKPINSSSTIFTDYYIDSPGATSYTKSGSTSEKINKFVSTSFAVTSKTKTNIADQEMHWIKSELNQQPNNSYGFFEVRWRTGGGHIMNYTIDNNNVLIRDSQNGFSYTVDEYFDRCGTSIGDVSYMRTDNLKINNEVAKQVAKRGGIHK